ncbi:MAG: hypothetical protein IJY00_01200, partial [Bacteroidaceae bacterium]|nr:hypothetical protein [Bacteroidaceae bacterium]
MSKYESSVKHIAENVDVVYGRFSDMRNLQALRDRMSDPDTLSQISGQVDSEKLEEARKYLKEMTFDADSLSVSTPVGALRLVIVERDAPKCIKLAGEGSPIPVYVWIQLLPEGEQATKMRVTVGAEVNMFMKGMVSKPLQQAA